MFQIHCQHARPSLVALGETVLFEVEPGSADLEHRVFLRHGPIRYLEAVRDWHGDSEPISILPEAPGDYEVTVEWRAPNGKRGWCASAFTVVVRRHRDDGPRRLRLDGNVKLWVPSRWDAMHLETAEGDLWRALPDLIEPNQVIYDVGANIGAFAVRLAHLTGPGGRVYCVEPNPLCIHYMRTNLAANQVTNAEILPTALLDVERETPFAVNYGNANLGATDAAAMFGWKGGHRIAVRGRTFDAMVHEHDFAPPEVIKIDVEGAEPLVVAGMAVTLEKHRPRFLIELHGLGPTGQTLEQLDRHGYRYRDPSGRIFEDAEAVWRHYGDAVFQLVADPR